MAKTETTTGKYAAPEQYTEREWVQDAPVEGDDPDLLYRIGIRDPITERVAVKRRNATPDEICEFCEDRRIDVPAVEGVYRQKLIRPGEDVSVFGLVRQANGERSAKIEANLVVRSAPEGREDQEPAFVVSTVSRAKLIARRWQFWIMVAIGGFLVVGNLLSTVGFAVLLLAT
jgi:hypothetical protein